MKFKLYTIFIISIFLFSCNFDNNNNNDVAIAELENRLIDLNNQIMDLNSNIERLEDNIANTQVSILALLSDSTFILPKHLRKQDVSEIEDKIDEEMNSVNPELLFKEKFSISSLSVLTCALRDVDKNKILRFYKEDLIEIDNNGIVEEFSILEINKLKKFIKVKSINYEIEFLMYMDAVQE